MTEQTVYKADVVVIGAGIAGASVAYELATEAHVIVVDMEDHPGYHSTGRSVAIFSEAYGPAPIIALTRCSRDFFENPPGPFGDAPLLTPRSVLTIAREDQMQSLDALYRDMAGQPGVHLVDEADLVQLSPLLRPGYAIAGMWEEGACDIDVNTLHQGYLRGLRHRGGEVFCNAAINHIDRHNGIWYLHHRAATYAAPIMVNAAGAWADTVAAMAGVATVGLVPRRRTALTIPAPPGVDPGPWPAVDDVDEQFYLKPEAGRLLLSPADETPSPPCDAQPDEMDIALCIDRVQKAFALNVERIENRWAGLRSFVSDRAPVCGFDPAVPGFFWLAGQGGYGIQSAPALSQLAAALIAGKPPPAALERFGFDVGAVWPGRFRSP